MARPMLVHSQIEINASPAAVRAVFLDFRRYNNWHQGWKIDPIDMEDKSAPIKAGARLRVDMQGMAFHPTVVENSAERFSWDGSLWGAIVGRHAFVFTPSKETVGGTTFVQSENFTGPLMIFFWPWSGKVSNSPNFESFNEALKKEVEKSPTKEGDNGSS